MVLNVVAEEILILRREGMVGLYLDVTQLLSQRNAPLTELHPFREGVYLPHEGTGVEIHGFVAFLELVQFLDHRHGDDDVVILEIFHALVVVQDDVGVQHENLGLLFSLHLPVYLRGIQGFAEFPPFQ